PVAGTQLWFVQVCPSGQPPQYSELPQLVTTAPQVAPADSQVVVTVQPHAPGVPPPPHVFHPLQVPQATRPRPSLSLTVPHVYPCWRQALGVSASRQSGPLPVRRTNGDPMCASSVRNAPSGP